MALVHSKNTVVTVDADDLSAYTNTSQFNPTTDEHDVTTYGQDGHVFAGGLTNGQFTMGGFYDSTASTGPRAVLQPIQAAGTAVTVVRRPQGTGAGLPQDSFSGLLTSYTESAPVADYQAWQATFRVSGDVNSAAQI